MKKYDDWIKVRYPDYNTAVGKCMGATDDMIVEFPELRKVRGEVTITGGFGNKSYMRLHSWCVDSDNKIIDPTFAQYFGYVVSGYIEYTPDHPALNYEQHKCMNCGKYFYLIPDHKFGSTCNSGCCDEFERYMNGQVNGGVL